MEPDSKILHLKFESSSKEIGRVDAGDFASTVSATAELLKFIAKGLETTKNKDIHIDLVASREGSFEADLAITIKNIVEATPVMVAFLADNHVISSAKQLIDIMKQLIQVKKVLQGEKPSKVEIVQNDGSPHVAIHGNSGTVNVSVNTFNLLQTEGAGKRLHKMVQPLLKEGTELDSIEISDEGGSEPVQVSKPEAPYFERTEELQMTEHKVRGVITAMDRKTCNGKISVGDKRINFEVQILDIAKLDKIVDTLIESMRNKVAILVIGKAAFDFESNLKHIIVNDVEKQAELFDPGASQVGEE